MTGAADRYDHYVDDNHYERFIPADDTAQQQILFADTTANLAGVSRDIQDRHISNCTKADPAYGAGVAKALGR